MPTLTSLNSKIKFKETRDDNKNTINNINKIQIVPTQNYIKINKELTEPSNTNTQRSPIFESIEKTNNRKVEEIYIPKKIGSINSINSNTKQSLTDSEGTPFSISPKLNITHHLMHNTHKKQYSSNNCQLKTIKTEMHDKESEQLLKSNNRRLSV